MNNNLSNTTPRLLIVDDLHPVFMEMIEAAGIQFDYRPDISREESLGILKNYEGLVLRSKFKVDAEAIDAASKLQIIARAGAGVDNINEVYAQKKGIYLVSAAEGNCDAVGEHMLAILLALLNKITIGNEEVKRGLWLREENRGIELGGKTVGLIGYGNNGKAMAKKLSGFDVEVLAYDKYKSNYGDANAKESTMDDIFLKADVLSLHIPLTSETRNLVDHEFLAKFSKSIFFLNGSRGEVVKIEDVIEGLKNKTILGAGFDVLPIEKFPALYDTLWYKELIGFNNVILTPHVAGWSVQSYFKLSRFLAEKTLMFFKGSNTVK